MFAPVSLSLSSLVPASAPRATAPVTLLLLGFTAIIVIVSSSEWKRQKQWAASWTCQAWRTTRQSTSWRWSSVTWSCERRRRRGWGEPACSSLWHEEDDVKWADGGSAVGQRQDAEARVVSLLLSVLSWQERHRVVFLFEANAFRGGVIQTLVVLWPVVAFLSSPTSLTSAKLFLPHSCCSQGVIMLSSCSHRSL